MRRGRVHTKMGQLFSRNFPPRPDQLPDQVSSISAPRPYQLRKGKEIGRGSYGEILEGTLGTRPVAIKRLHRIFLDYAEHNQEALEGILETFKRECELLEKAKSPHVVEFLGVFPEEKKRSFSDGVDVPNVAQVP